MGYTAANKNTDETVVLQCTLQGPRECKRRVCLTREMITFTVTSGYERVIGRSGKCSQRYELFRPTYRLCSKYNDRIAIVTSCYHVLSLLLCFMSIQQFMIHGWPFPWSFWRHSLLLLSRHWMFCRQLLLFRMVCLCFFCCVILVQYCAGDGIKPSTLVLYLKTR